MDEFEDPIELTGYICYCDNPNCLDGMCDPMNWPDEEVISEFILQMYDIEDDGDLTLEFIIEWYW